MAGAIATHALSDQALESVTRLIGEARAGQTDAWDRIYALLYDDLRRVARSQIRQQRRGAAGSPTSLISETWLRLAGSPMAVNDRSHLITLMARAMRFVLLDETRRMLTEKRGEGAEMLSLDEAPEPGQASTLDQLLSLDQALNALARLDSRLADVVELRYFGGLTEPEVAEILGVTERTIRRDWRKARAFLHSQLGDAEQSLLPGD
ncbi:MAG: ECF-type sigma factor [Luteimonas sp.]|nr:ECF-type sigma factor [Luteimonas sp.]